MNLKSIFNRILIMCSLLVMMTACVDLVSEREGTEIQVVPITYQINLEVKNGDFAAARRELDEYVTNNFSRVATQQITFKWYSKVGEKLAKDYQKQLLSQGVNRNQIQLLMSPANSDTSADLTFESIVNRVVVEVCGYENVNYYTANGGGCYAEGARWRSMVNPEKMLMSNSK